MLPELKLLNILLVEDATIMMKVHTKLLTELGFSPDCASSSVEALILATSHEYDVIFMDIGLPKMNGLEVATKIRQHEQDAGKKQAYIIALTAYCVGDDILKKCHEAGINKVKEKPILLKELREVLWQFARTGEPVY